MVVTTMMMDYMEMETPTNNHTTKQTTTTSPSPSYSYQQYMLALQEERRKIQVFHRELPLCLDLVNQAIENCKQHVYSGERERSQCAEEDEHQQQTSSEEPVLEEFIPLKRTEEEQEEKSDNTTTTTNKCDEKNGKKVDWLRSVQLWNQHPDSPSQETTPQIKENGGAFHRFGENKVKVSVKEVSTTTTPSVVKESIPKTITSPTPTASTSSTADNSNKRKEEKDAQLNRKTRRCWSPELHRRFLQALQQLGGSHAATPKQIRELMKVDGLTNDEVKSHLQKYRLHTRRPGPSMPNNGNTEPTQFVLVGGIWVPPQNYAAAGTAKGDSPSTAQERVYVPVTAPTHITLPSHHHHQQQQQERKLLQLSTGSSPSEQKNSRVEHSMGDENAHSGSSAATSSSTETTTASPNF